MHQGSRQLCRDPATGSQSGLGWQASLEVHLLQSVTQSRLDSREHQSPLKTERSSKHNGQKRGCAQPLPQPLSSKVLNSRPDHAGRVTAPFPRGTDSTVRPKAKIRKEASTTCALCRAEACCQRLARSGSAVTVHWYPPSSPAGCRCLPGHCLP